jgi:cytochrome c oxidase subunit 3
MAIVVQILAFRGEFDAEHRLGIQAVKIYWQFVALIWLPVFVVLFLVPRWL